MTTLREGLFAPVVEPPAEGVEQLVAFLERQSRIRLAVWMSHAHGADADQHLLFGIDERDWSEGDLGALEQGLEREVAGFHAWLDVFSLADAGAVRADGLVLWEQTSPGADPLDYRLTHEPFAADAAALERFAALLRELRAVRRAGATVEKLWKGDDLLEERARLFVDAPPQANALFAAGDAAGETIFAGWASTATQLGRPDDEAAILYEATA